MEDIVVLKSNRYKQIIKKLLDKDNLRRLSEEDKKFLSKEGMM